MARMLSLNLICLSVLQIFAGVSGELPWKTDQKCAGSHCKTPAYDICRWDDDDTITTDDSLVEDFIQDCKDTCEEGCASRASHLIHVCYNFAEFDDSMLESLSRYVETCPAADIDNFESFCTEKVCPVNTADRYSVDQKCTRYEIDTEDSSDSPREVQLTLDNDASNFQYSGLHCLESVGSGVSLRVEISGTSSTNTLDFFSLKSIEGSVLITSPANTYTAITFPQLVMAETLSLGSGDSELDIPVSLEALESVDSLSFYTSNQFTNEISVPNLQRVNTALTVAAKDSDSSSVGKVSFPSLTYAKEVTLVELRLANLFDFSNLHEVGSLSGTNLCIWPGFENNFQSLAIADTIKMTFDDDCSSPEMKKYCGLENLVQANSVIIGGDDTHATDNGLDYTTTGAGLASFPSDSGGLASFPSDDTPQKFEFYEDRQTFCVDNSISDASCSSAYAAHIETWDSGNTPPDTLGLVGSGLTCDGWVVGAPQQICDDLLAELETVPFPSNNAAPQCPDAIYDDAMVAKVKKFFITCTALYEIQHKSILFKDDIRNLFDTVQVCVFDKYLISSESFNVASLPLNNNMFFDAKDNMIMESAAPIVINSQSANAYLGIGQTDPQYKLDVDGDIRAKNVEIGGDLVIGGLTLTKQKLETIMAKAFEICGCYGPGSLGCVSAKSGCVCANNVEDVGGVISGIRYEQCAVCSSGYTWVDVTENGSGCM